MTWLHPLLRSQPLYIETRVTSTVEINLYIILEEYKLLKFKSWNYSLISIIFNYFLNLSNNSKLAICCSFSQRSHKEDSFNVFMFKDIANSNIISSRQFFNTIRIVIWEALVYYFHCSTENKQVQGFIAALCANMCFSVFWEEYPLFSLCPFDAPVIS